MYILQINGKADFYKLFPVFYLSVWTKVSSGQAVENCTHSNMNMAPDIEIDEWESFWEIVNYVNR